MMKGFSCGLITGAILGAAAGMLADPIKDRQHAKMSRKKREMFKAVGDVIDNVMDMF
ncbi:MAG: YtxH domain-containing protein [Clostridia bacterium]|nr:YtxH domain-containing protein [Oscillospiraceae bacterium]MDY5627587.1 YtxH domain-containing protein [Clostridia bacterium]